MAPYLVSLTVYSRWALARVGADDAISRADPTVEPTEEARTMMLVSCSYSNTAVAQWGRMARPRRASVEWGSCSRRGAADYLHGDGWSG